jgi:hypothetical protein
MNIRLHHKKAYDWKVVDLKNERPKPGEVIGTNAQGDMTRRVEVPSDFTDIEFSMHGVASIQADRKNAGLREISDCQVIAKHIEDAVLPLHCPEISDLTCENKDLEEYLKMYFGLKGK